MLFDCKPDKLLLRTLYRTRVAAHVILKVREEDAMNDALFASLSNYIERANMLTGISKKTLSRIKAELEKVGLVPRKPRSDGMRPCDFDKCEICINCKITYEQDNKLYMITKGSSFWVSNHYLFITLQKYITNVYELCALPT